MYEPWKKIVVVLVLAALNLVAGVSVIEVSSEAQAVLVLALTASLAWAGLRREILLLAFCIPWWSQIGCSGSGLAIEPPVARSGSVLVHHDNLELDNSFMRAELAVAWLGQPVDIEVNWFWNKLLVELCWDLGFLAQCELIPLEDPQCWDLDGALRGCRWEPELALEWTDPEVSGPRE